MFLRGFFDFVTTRAGMFPVKGLADTRSQTRGLGIVHQHTAPGNALHEGKVGSTNIGQSAKAENEAQFFQANET